MNILDCLRSFLGRPSEEIRSKLININYLADEILEAERQAIGEKKRG